MPSIKRFFFFSKKKGHGSKFHGYNNLKHSTYPTTPAANHHQHHPPPPHTLSHRQHLYPQQLIMQSPQPQSQVIQTTTIAANQCQCQQCSLQQQLSHHQSALSPQTTTPAQVSAPQPQAQMSPLMQPHSQSQMQLQQCQQQYLPFRYHSPTHHYVSQQANGQLQSTTPMGQCVCNHCPYSQQQQSQHHHHHHQQHQFQQQQQVIADQQPIQHFSILQLSGMCQHQGNNNQSNQHPIRQQYHTYNPIVQQAPQVCPSHPPQQLAPVILSPPTTGFQQQPPQCQQQQQQQTESRSHDFSRYANMQSLMDDSLHTQKTRLSQSKFQEHVYCNQKSEFTLPPYEPPPDYNTFMERRKMYAIELSGQHMTHHSESLVLQRTKDSSYENLRTRFSPYSNLGVGRQEPGYNS